MSRDVTLVNDYYPIAYFAEPNIEVISSQDATQFWASTEKAAPATEELTFDLGRLRPINFVDFEISQKPIDVQVFYKDGVNWIETTPSDDQEPQLSVQYFPSLGNAWHRMEHLFELVETQYLKLVFTRREDRFPLRESDPFEWSIEIRNARLMYLIRSADTYIPDTGTDILGNSFRTELQEYPAETVLDDDNEFWQSQMNPSPFAVESLYFDLRVTAQSGVMSYLNTQEQGELDDRSMADMALYYADGQMIDEIYIDPITFGSSMHIYYSYDDTPDWDNKMWIPIPRHYTLRQGYHSLPRSTYVKYLKLEFSRLTPIPYNVADYPNLPAITYRKYPTWVYHYFNNADIDRPSSNIIDPIERITIDPLVLGFHRPDDNFDEGRKQVPGISPIAADPTQELQDFISELVQTQQLPIEPQQEVESRIRFFSNAMYQGDLIDELDTTRALSRIAQQGVSGLAAELRPSAESPPTVQSVVDLTAAKEEKELPILWFPMRCRHGYQVVQTERPYKVAYYVAIRFVSFHRRDYTVEFDEPFYLETFGDDAHIQSNDFTQDDGRFIITP